MENITLYKWQCATAELGAYFARKYFGKDCEAWWIADDIGGVMYINDRFFSPSDMADFIKCRYSPAKMFEYYDYALGCRERNESPINIKAYRHWKK